MFGQEGKEELKSEAFKEFFARTEHWLVPYAQYCYLRDKNGTAVFSQWPDHQSFNEADRRALTGTGNPAYKNVAFYYFMQYVLSRQMQEAHDRPMP